MLEHPHRIVGAEHCDGAAEADGLGAGGGGEDHGGRRGDELLAVVLAEGEHVEADLIGQLDLFEQVGEALGGAHHLARERVGGPLHE